MPTELARGPWTNDALHGGPVAALLARAVEAIPTPGPMLPMRFTMDLLRPVGFEPLVVESALARPGRKVQLVEATAATDAGVVARAMALRIRAEAVVAPDDPPAVVPPGPEHGERQMGWRENEDTAFHNSAVEHRFVLGRFDRPGPATDWVRLQHPVVPGEVPTPFQRVVAAADFGNGLSGELDFDQYAYVNPDLTVHLFRLPVGEWVCLEASTRLGSEGTALAESALYDTGGPIGRSLQSLIVEAR